MLEDRFSSLTASGKKITIPLTKKKKKSGVATKEESKEKLTYLKPCLQDTSTVPFSHPQSISNFNPLMHKHIGGAAPGESQAVSRQAQQLLFLWESRAIPPAEGQDSMPSAKDTSQTFLLCNIPTWLMIYPKQPSRE